MAGIKNKVCGCKEVTVFDCLCETCIEGEQTDGYHCELNECALFQEVGARVYKNRTCIEGMEDAILLKELKYIQRK
jgi:hypothetical protein